MIIEITGQKYSVRNNFLHRLAYPRLVLNLKENGKFVSIQFDNNAAVYSDIVNETWKGKMYVGYWVGGNKHLKQINIQIKTTSWQ